MKLKPLAKRVLAEVEKEIHQIVQEEEIDKAYYSAM